MAYSLFILQAKGKICWNLISYSVFLSPSHLKLFSFTEIVSEKTIFGIKQLLLQTFPEIMTSVTTWFGLYNAIRNGLPNVSLFLWLILYNEHRTQHCTGVHQAGYFFLKREAFWIRLRCRWRGELTIDQTVENVTLP